MSGNAADRRALEARDREERNLNPGTFLTLGYMLDEVEATRPAGMDEGEAIRILVEDRVERFLFSRSEGDKVLDMLDREASRPYDVAEPTLVASLRKRIEEQQQW